MKARLQATLSLILACFLLILPPVIRAQDGGNSLVTAEAFLDDPDLAPGSGIPLTLTGDPLQPWNEARETVDLTGQTAGVHTIYVRFKDAYGDWSDPIGQSFYIPEGSLGGGGNVGGANRIQTAEAFFDTDPGSGAGFPVAVPVDGAINASSEVLRGLVSLGGVSPGQHTVYFRFQDTAGVWSAPVGQSVYITPELIGSVGANALTAAEYRIDAGAFQTTSVDDGALGGVQELVERVQTVSNDYHTFRVRFQNSAGHWSQSPDAPPPNPDDNDNDGLSDAWEQQWFGNLNQSGSDDPDGDGLTNLEEQQRGTNPLTADDLSLVAYYPFNGNANDESGNGNDGTVYGATLTEDRFGNADSAYLFDGIDDYITLPHSEQINFSGNDNYSVALWAKVISIPSGGHGGIVEKWSGSGGYPFVIRYAVDSPTVHTHTAIYDGTNNPGPQSDKDLIDGAFHQIVLIKSDNSILLYIDGQLENSVADTTTGSIQNSSVVYVGRRLASNRYFNGVIDDIKIYNRALSETEIQNLYNGGGSPGTAPEATIDSIAPTDPTEGDLVEFTGSAGPADQVIEQYHWSAARLVGGVPEAARLDIGSTPEFITDILPAGDWRIYLQVRNSDGLWSAPTMLDITVEDDLGLSDLAVNPSSIRFLNQDGESVINPEQGDSVTIQVEVQNLGEIDTPDEVTLSLYDGDPETGVLIAKTTVPAIAAGDSVTLTAPWQVGHDASGTPIPGYQDDFKVITIEAEFTGNLGQQSQAITQQANKRGLRVIAAKAELVYPELTQQNNRASAAVRVGQPIGSYGIALTANSTQIPYTGGTVTLFGQANYSWGQHLPVMGAQVTVKLDATGATLATTFTTAPNGLYVAKIQVPADPGNYDLTITVFDQNLYGTATLSLGAQTPPTPQEWEDQNPSGGAPPAPAPTRDLVVSQINLSGSGFYHPSALTDAAVLDASLQVSAVIRNKGSLPIDNGFAVSFYDGNPETDGVLLAIETVAAGLAGSTSTLVTSSVPWLMDTLGYRAIYVVVDELNAVAEQNEYNNTKNRSVQVREYLPDLRPERVSFSGTLVVGQPVTVYADVYNNGPAPLNTPPSFDVAFYLGDPAQGQEIGRVPFSGSLAQGQKSTASVEWTPAAVSSGSIVVVVDPNNAVAEDFETNNRISKRFGVLSDTADIWPVELEFSNYAPRPNTTVAINAIIQNKGVTEAENVPVDFFLGDPDAGGSLIGTDIIDILHGQSSRSDIGVNWTTPATAGTYRVYVRVGSRKYYRTLTVSNNPPPDLRVYSASIVIDPEFPTAGDTVAVSATIQNGSSETAATDFAVRFTVDTPAGTYPLGEPVSWALLSPNAAVVLPATATITVDQPYYAILVEIVPNPAQGDANYGNNAATRSFAGVGGEAINVQFTSADPARSTYGPGNAVTLHWTTTGLTPGQPMVLSMKRASASDDPPPNNPNWYQFTTTAANDGGESVVIPAGLAEADDWTFCVGHEGSGKFDCSAPFSYRNIQVIVTAAVTTPAKPEGEPFRPFEQVTIQWKAVGADVNDPMVVSMKRFSASGLPAPDNLNWYRFTSHAPYPCVNPAQPGPGNCSTTNDGLNGQGDALGEETVTIPTNLAEGSDWDFCVRHVESDAWDCLKDYFIYQNKGITFKAPNDAGAVYWQGRTLNLEWETVGIDETDEIVLSMKRDSVAGQPEPPNGVDWVRFPVTNNALPQLREILIPDTVVAANDWRFFVKHTDTGRFSASEPFAVRYVLQATKAGTGTGAVTKTAGPQGVDCGTLCEAFEDNDVVTLTAQWDTNMTVFTGWSGACSGTAPDCVVTMDDDKAVTATFDPVAPAEYTLTIALDPVAGGRVVAYGNDILKSITCEAQASCTKKYSANEQVTLSAYENAGYQFDKWIGCTPDDSTVCSVTMDGDKTVTINFNSTKISISDVEMREGSGNYQPVRFDFTVSRSNDTSAVSIDYQTVSDTAVASQDFIGATGTLNFVANDGNLTKTITVQINGDKIAEENEVFFVDLTNASGAVIDKGRGQGMIIDDDNNRKLIYLDWIRPMTGTFIDFINGRGEPDRAYVPVGPSVSFSPVTNAPEAFRQQLLDETQKIFDRSNIPFDVLEYDDTRLDAAEVVVHFAWCELIEEAEICHIAGNSCGVGTDTFNKSSSSNDEVCILVDREGKKWQGCEPDDFDALECTKKASRVAKTIAHEAAHALGAQHIIGRWVPGEEVDARDVMDYDEDDQQPEIFYDKPAIRVHQPREQKWEQADGITTNSAHNPKYHILRYVFGYSDAELENSNISPGPYDKDNIDQIVLRLNQLAFDGVIYDLAVLGSGYSAMQSTEKPEGSTTLAYFKYVDPQNLNNLEWTFKEGDSFRILGASRPGGIFDLYLTTSDTLEPEIPPETLQTGVLTGRVVQYSSNQSPEIVGSFSATVDPVATISPDDVVFVSPHDLRFGEVALDSYKDLNLKISNIGEIPVEITCTTPSVFTLMNQCNNRIIPAKSTEEITVRFTPNDANFIVEHLIISSEEGDTVIKLQGIGDDQDGSTYYEDNCPTISNPDQTDSDNDGIGDACDPENNSADLSLNKIDSADPVTPSGEFSYTLAITNAGPSAANNLQVQDTLPAGVAFVSATGDGWTCAEDSAVVTCTRTSLGVETAPVITVNVTAPTTAGVITNTAAVSANEHDPNDADNTASEDTTIEGGAASDRDGDGVPDDEDAFPDDPNESADGDGDGVGDNADCNDTDPAIYPGATEICDRKDNDCNPATPERDCSPCVLP